MLNVARTWLHGEAEAIDTTHLTPAQAAQQIAKAVRVEVSTTQKAGAE